MNRIINLTDERRERKHEYPKIKPHLPTNPENATYKTSSRHRSPQVCASCRQRGRPHFHSAPDHHHHAPPPHPPHSTPSFHPSSPASVHHAHRRPRVHSDSGRPGQCTAVSRPQVVISRPRWAGSLGVLCVASAD